MSAGYLYDRENRGCCQCIFGVDTVSFSLPTLQAISLSAVGKKKGANRLFLNRVIHLSLFVMACMAMQKRRREATKAVAERRNIELQYHRSPEEHRARSYPMGDHDKDIEANNGALALKDVEANNGAPAVKYA